MSFSFTLLKINVVLVETHFIQTFAGLVQNSILFIVWQIKVKFIPMQNKHYDLNDEAHATLFSYRYLYSLYNKNKYNEHVATK